MGNKPGTERPGHIRWPQVQCQRKSGDNVVSRKIKQEGPFSLLILLISKSEPSISSRHLGDQTCHDLCSLVWQVLSLEERYQNVFVDLRSKVANKKESATCKQTIMRRRISIAIVVPGIRSCIYFVPLDIIFIIWSWPCLGILYEWPYCSYGCKMEIFGWWPFRLEVTRYTMIEIARMTESNS